ncbi:MAG: MFS transporter [Rhodospirillales bacterium]|nr:MFS transporter [Rhodospirillales bacterium]
MLNRSRLNVILLSVALAFGMGASSLVMTTAAVVGNILATDKTLSTLPVALMFVGTMATTVPASFLMRRIGRKAGFLIGIAIGLAGCAITTTAILGGDFVAFCAGMVLLGSSTAFVQYYRFAAADTASLEFRSTAISLVMAGGVVAALIGPNLATYAKDLFAPVTFAGSFASIALLQIGAIAAISFIEIPKAAFGSSSSGGRPLLVIARQPAYVVAVVSATLGYAVMTFVMTATPLAIVGCAYPFADAAFVIQWHVLGMFVPSFFTGRLIKRFGVLRVMAAGVMMYAGTMAFGLTGTELIGNFWAALVLLGVGWNFLYVGGTTLLTETYAPEEKAKAQALNDFTVSTTVALASLSSGALQARFGWEGIVLGILPALVVIAAAVAWLTWMRARGEETPLQA